MSKVNVLCLHGCCQNEEMFRGLLKEYIKIGQRDNNLEFFFVEAMYHHPDNGKTWYNRPLEVSKIGTIPYESGLIKECMEQIDSCIRSNNITVLLGFSQGANVVDTYLRTGKDHPIKKVVLFSGYSLVDEKMAMLDIPIMNVYSHEDEIVCSKYRPTQYRNITDVVHTKGHRLPTSKPVIRDICRFMDGH